MTTGFPSIRYMGSKRTIAPRIVQYIDDVVGHGAPFVDLFGGSGAVAGVAAANRVVHFGDELAFAVGIARSRFLPLDRAAIVPGAEIALRASAYLRERVVDRELLIAEEESAMFIGPAALERLISGVLVPDTDHTLLNVARDAKYAIGADHYRMAELYYSRGYFSTYQSLAIDCLRRSIDELHSTGASCEIEASSRDLALAAFIIVLSKVVNAPGHTAQYFKSNSMGSFRAVLRSWRRSVLDEFVMVWDAIISDSSCRRPGNTVLKSDAMSAIQARGRDWSRGVVYADPPYTKDQYSRFYHLLEALYAYDFPPIHGIGRVSENRIVSDFSRKTRVEEAFRLLAEQCARSEIPLAVSYPAVGLLDSTGLDLGDLLSSFGPCWETTLSIDHSSLGASKGRQYRPVVERLIVVRPS